MQTNLPEGKGLNITGSIQDFLSLLINEQIQIGCGWILMHKHWHNLYPIQLQTVSDDVFP
jgi:hypothetical protein